MCSMSAKVLTKGSVRVLSRYGSSQSNFHWPAYLPIDSLSNTSWRASATRIASACVSHSFVLPSMSVNRNVTVPTGSGAAGAAPARFLVNQRARRGTANDPI